MNVRELYRICFGDGEAFTDHFFYERGGFPVTVEENGELAAMAFVCPRLLRVPEFHNALFDTLTPRRPTDDLIRAAMIGGVCTHPDFRRRGFASRVMEKTISVCRELGFEALFLSPFDDTFYHRFGFEDIEWAETLRVRNSKYDEFVAYRYGDPAAERRFGELGVDEVAYHITTAVESFNADAVGFVFTADDFKRLAREAETGTDGGLYLIADRRRALGAVLKDGAHLQYVFMRQDRADLVLAKTVYRDTHIFGGCTMDRILTRPDGAEHPRVYMQALIFDRKSFEEKITGYRGFFDPELYRFKLFEQY